MKKSVKKRIIKSSALFQIFLMISLSFAVAVLMSESVSAQDPPTFFDPNTLPPSEDIPVLYSGGSKNVISGFSATSPVSTSSLPIPMQNPGLLEGFYGGNNEFINPFLEPRTPIQFPLEPVQGSISPPAVTPPAISSGNSLYDLNQKTSISSSTDAVAGQDNIASGGNSLYDLNQKTSIGDELDLTAPTPPTPGVKQEEFKVPGLDTPIYGGYAHLAKGLVFAATVAGVIQLIGGIAGLDDGLTTSLTYSAVGGIMAAKTVAAFGNTGGFNAFGKTYGQGMIKGEFLNSAKGQFVVGLAVAAAIFVLTYKDTETKKVTFQCMPWEAPTGGTKCEDCNKYPFRPCTEYRCKSLGQACELLNANTPNAQCAWVSRNDVNSPKITPLESALYPNNINLKYEPDNRIRPPAIGSKITSAGACLPAFTPLEFGISLNEPAQCKIDYNHTTKFDEMQYYFGDDNYYKYNHTQKLRLPGPGSDLSSIQIINDGTMGLFVRCRDANGNENVDEYVFTFCVDKGPDKTLPIMEEFSIPYGSPVTYNIDNVPIQLYINEPATCKWSVQDKNYNDMENTMTCYNNPNQVNADLQYTCASNLTGVKNREENRYYFRCKDQPDKPDNERNTNQQSKELMIRGSQPLTLIKVLPNETVTGGTEYVTVNLELETGDGADKGKALCYFSPTGNEGSFIQMFETDNFRHKQVLSLTNGLYRYYFRCVDYGGNLVQNATSFRVFSDRQAPKVTRAYKDEALKIVTNEDAECFYSISSCDFNINDGEKMIYSNPEEMKKLFTEWKAGQVYHIKCRDPYGNQPSPNSCSAVISSVEISKESV